MVGTALVLLGTTALTLVVWLERTRPPLAMAAYVLAGAGHGLRLPAPERRDAATCRPTATAAFNSSALAIADSLGAALALVGHGRRLRRAPTAAGADAFVAVYLVAVARPAPWPPRPRPPHR